MRPCGVFEPILASSRGTIFTWGLPEKMPTTLLHRFGSRGPWTINVGFFSGAGDTYIGTLVNRAKTLLSCAPRTVNINFAPNCHIKAWVLDTGTWVGSANLAADTIGNIMVKVPYTAALRDTLDSVYTFALQPGKYMEMSCTTNTQLAYSCTDSVAATFVVNRYRR